MGRQTAILASVLFACLSAGCAETPSPRLANAPLGQSAASDPLESCGASGASYASLASRNDCSALVSELRGVHTVTLEFSDRYQAVTVPIQVYTMSWVTHVDFVLPDGRLLGATPFGVRIRKWTPAIHTVRYTFDADAEKVLGFALSQLGKPYDYVGVTTYALRIGMLHQPGSWFCSSLVEAAALQDGVDLSGKTPRFSSPAAIKASLLLTRVKPERTYLADRADRPAATPAAYPLPSTTAAPIADGGILGDHEFGAAGKTQPLEIRAWRPMPVFHLDRDALIGRDPLLGAAARPLPDFKRLDDEFGGFRLGFEQRPLRLGALDSNGPAQHRLELASSD